MTKLSSLATSFGGADGEVEVGHTKTFIEQGVDDEQGRAEIGTMLIQDPRFAEGSWRQLGIVAPARESGVTIQHGATAKSA